jgi:hypothetical protein
VSKEALHVLAFYAIAGPDPKSVGHRRPTGRLTTLSSDFRETLMDHPFGDSKTSLLSCITYKQTLLLFCIVLVAFQSHTVDKRNMSKKHCT